MPLTHADLGRLKRATGSSPSDFVELSPPDAVDMSGEPSSFVELDVGRRLMVLARRDGACVFLRGDRCSVWPARPLACRTYPLSATLGERAGIRRLELAPRGVDCRYALDAETSLREIRDAELCQERELARFHELVARFNRIQRTRRQLHRRAANATQLFNFLNSEV